MLTWLAENSATIPIGLAVAAILAAVLSRMHQNKKKGKPSCGCGCGGCPIQDKCHETAPESHTP